MMLVGFVFVDFSLHHGFEDFYDNLDMIIGLWIVRGCKLMHEVEKQRQFLEYFVLEMFYVVNKCLGTPKPVMTWLKKVHSIVSTMLLYIGIASTHLLT
jgi:hypothetical protein